MRLVRFDDPAQGTTIELHPQLTVLRGLSGDLRERFLHALSSLPRGRDPESKGALEVHGVLLDLSLESLELLELDADLDVVVRRADVPGASDALQSGPEDPEGPPVGAGSAEVDPTGEAVGLAHLTERAAAARACLEAELEERGRLTAAIDSARGSLDSFAVTALEVAVADLEELDHRRREAARQLREQRRHEVEARIDSLHAEVDSVESELERMRAVDTSSIRTTLAVLESSKETTPVPSPEAQELAEQLRVVDEQLLLLQGQAATGRSQLAELTSRRDAAYDAMVAAERLLRAPDLDHELIEELERVHDEIFELDGRVSKLSGGRIRRRMTELRTREAHLLHQLGFDTWASYVMGVSSSDAEGERVRRYEVARATYDFAEDELAKAASTPSLENPDLLRVQGRRQQLLERSSVVLGHATEGDPTAELRALRVPAGSLVGPLDVAAEGLCAALESVGVTTARAAESVGELVDVAQRWLGMADVLPQRIAEEEDHLTRVQSDLAAESQRLSELSDETEQPGPAPEDDPELSTARQRVEECQDRAARHNEALGQLAELQHEMDQAAEREAAARERLHEAEQAIALEEEAEEARRVAAESAAAASGRSAGDRHGSSPDTADAIEWYLLARLAQQRSLSFVGSIPLVLDDALIDWPFEEVKAVYLRLCRMSEVVQIVVLSDDLEVAGWAHALSGERASVLDVAVGL